MSKDNMLIITQKEKNEKNFRTFSVRLPADMCDKIDTICAQTNRSRNEVMVTLLLFGLENYVVTA